MVGLPLNLGDAVGALITSASKYAYAAQTMLPNHPALTNGGILNIVAQQAGSVTNDRPRGWGNPAPTDGTTIDEQEAIGNALRGIAGPFAVTPEDTAEALASPQNPLRPVMDWFDFQRVGFLVLGLILIGVGITFIVRNAGNAALDDQLKKAQLDLTNAQLRQQPKREQPVLKAIRGVTKRKPSNLNPPRDHSGDPRPDFGRPLIDADIPDRTPLWGDERPGGFGRAKTKRINKKK